MYNVKLSFAYFFFNYSPHSLNTSVTKLKSDTIFMRLSFFFFKESSWPMHKRLLNYANNKKTYCRFFCFNNEFIILYLQLIFLLLHSIPLNLPNTFFKLPEKVKNTVPLDFLINSKKSLYKHIS